MNDPITLCDGCRQNKPLKPFVTFKSARLWWVESLIETRRFCDRCHARAVEHRKESYDSIPAWYWFGMALSNYVPPEPELTLKQASLL